MLQKRTIEGPTLAEWAIADLTPERARLLQQALVVGDDNSVSLNFAAPPAAIAQAAKLFSRLGIKLRYRPVRLGPR